MTATRSLEDIRTALLAFVAEWAGAEGYEMGQAQEFVRELFQAYGIPPARVTAFEQRVRTATGTGRIDAFIPKVVLVEMKSRGKDLEAAQRQAFEYMETLDAKILPAWVMVSDFTRIRVVDAGTGVTAAEFETTDLPENMEALGFLAGYSANEYTPREQEAASVKAAQLMARLYEALDSTGYPEHDASRFMVRVLFCLYADDAGLFLPSGLFTRFVRDLTREDGSDLGAQLVTLFQMLNTERERRQSNLPQMVRQFPYVNGGLFAEPVSIPYLDRTMRDRLLECCELKWSAISPAIFGSLFQAVKSKEARRQLGEHYTTETNIQKLIGPLFMDELHQRYVKAYDSVRLLQRLQADMGQLRFLDPACGCGNFLVVAYREMRSLELDVLKRLQELDLRRAQMVMDAETLSVVRLESFAGIEIEEWPATIASAALHLVHHQANERMGKVLGLTPEPLPLHGGGRIRVANALRTDWAEVMPPSPNLVILSNPPFLGHATRSEEQSRELRDVWGREDIGRLDYVTGWYKKAIDYFGTVGGRWAYVSTSSVAQGDQVPRLFGPVLGSGWRIRFAHRTFAWTSEAPGAAAVHCVIVGFDRVAKPAPRLFTYRSPGAAPVEIPVTTGLNGYLVDAPHVMLRAHQGTLNPQLPAATFGSTPRDGGNLIIEPDEYPVVAADPIAAKYLRPFRGARELLHGGERWCLWLVGLETSDVQQSPILAARIEATRQWRSESKSKDARDAAATPHLFWWRNQPVTRYLAIPSVVSESRHYFTADWYPPEVIASNLVFTADDPEGLAFAIVSSSMFISWQRAVGGTLESRLRFSGTVVWNNLPLPTLDDAGRARVIAAGRGVLEARALRPERSLADHYNPNAMDPALLRAHRELDAVVDRTFGAKALCADNLERQAILFKRYEEMTAGLIPTTPANRGRRRAVAVAP